MSMQLTVFKYGEDEDHFDDLTTINIDGEIWFVAHEVCNMLDIKNSRDAVASLDEDEKQVSVIPTLGQNKKVNIISESGLYSLVFRSKKPSAKKFRRWVTKEVIPSIRKTGSYGINRTETANFVIRFNDNWERVDKGHFSVISELYVRLYGRFEMLGYKIPNKAFTGKEIRPDVSVGKMFADYLRIKHSDLAGEFKMYSHLFKEINLEVEARQYKNSVLEHFITFIDEVWIPKQAQKYFKDRDPVALDYLPKLIGGSDYGNTKTSLN